MVELECEQLGERRFFDPCSVPGVTEPIEIAFEPGIYSLDTTAGIMTDPSGAPIEIGGVVDLGPASTYVIVASGFELSAVSSLRVTGERPLAIISWGGVEIAGILDVSSSPDPLARGAGALDPGGGLCAGDLGGEGSEGGGSGAAGGAFGGDGGSGGDSGMGGTTGATAAGAIAAETLELQGGCGGGDGGRGQNNVPGGIGGDGGGAVLLSSLGTIEITGVIDANGTGGRAPPLDRRAGGGGGGSGGLIALEADVVEIRAAAAVVANGGGGGGGCNNASPACTDGDDPGRDGLAAPGGGSDQSGVGGAGGALINLGVGQPGVDNPQRGGGGGGGAAGHVLVLGATTVAVDGMISPAEQVLSD